MDGGAPGHSQRGWKEPVFLWLVYQYLVDGLSSLSPPPFFYKRQKTNGKLN